MSYQHPSILVIPISRPILGPMFPLWAALFSLCFPIHRDTASDPPGHWNLAPPPYVVVVVVVGVVVVAVVVAAAVAAAVRTCCYVERPPPPPPSSWSWWSW